MINISFFLFFCFYLFNISKSKTTSHITEEILFISEQATKTDILLNQLNTFSFIELSPNQTNTLNLSSPSFPLYVYIPLPKSQNVNINIKFMEFIYEQQFLSSENEFTVFGYLLNEQLDSNNISSFMNTPQLNAKYFIPETTAFFNIDTSTNNYFYIIIMKSENNANMYTHLNIDIYCNIQNEYINYVSPINRYIFGNINSNIQSVNNINKMVYAIKNSNFIIELIEKGNNNLLEWNIEYELNNNSYHNNANYINNIISYRGIKKIYVNNSDTIIQNTNHYAIIYIKSSLNKSIDYMIKFTEMKEHITKYSSKIYTRISKNKIYFTFDNIFHNNENINYITYTIKGFATNISNNNQLDSPFNLYVGETGENIPEYQLTKTENINPVTNTITYSLPIPNNNTQTHFTFYINAHLRTNNNEHIIIYDITPISLKDSNGYKELVLNYINVLGLEDNPFNQPYIQQLPKDQNKNIHFHIKYHNFCYKTTTPSSKYILNNELSLNVMIYQVNETFISAYKNDPSIQIPTTGIKAHEFKFDHVIMYDFDNVSETYLFITIEAIQSEVDLFQNFDLNILVNVNDNKSPTWVLPLGFYYINSINSSHKKIYSICKNQTSDKVFYIELSHNINPNFTYAIEEFKTNPNFANDTSIIKDSIIDIDRDIIILETNQEYLTISFWENPYNESNNNQFTLKYYSFPTQADIPSFSFDKEIEVKYEYNEIGTPFTWTLTTENLMVLFVNVSDMYFLYRFYSQNNVTELDNINSILIPPDTEDPYEPYLTFKRKIIIDDLYVTEQRMLSNEVNYVSLICRFETSYGEYKASFYISAINATVIPLELITSNSQIVKYSNFSKYKTKGIYLYMEIKTTRPEMEFNFNWKNVTYDTKEIYVDDYFDINVFFVDYKFIINRGLNDTISKKEFNVSNGKHFPFENVNMLYINTNIISNKYDYLYIEIQQSENNTNVYKDFELDMTIMENNEHSFVKVLYPDEYLVYKKLPNSKYVAFEIYRKDVSYNACSLEFGIRDNNPNLKFSIEIGNVPKYTNESSLNIHDTYNKVIMDLHNISNSKVYLYVFNTSISSQPIEFYIKSEFAYNEANLTNINYSHMFIYNKTYSNFSFENIRILNPHLNISEITYELHTYYVKNISHIEYLNSLFIPSLIDNPFYLSCNNITIRPTHNTTQQLSIPFNVEMNELYYFVFKAFGYYEGGHRFKLKYDIKVINTTFIDFPIIDNNNIAVKQYVNTSTSLQFIPLYFHIKQIEYEHNIDVLFKYKCKHIIKNSDDIFNVIGYTVDFDFIGHRKENDTEPQVTTSPMKAITLKEERTELLKINTSYTYVIISMDPMNNNTYESIDFQIIINDKESNEVPKFSIYQNEFYYGKIGNEKDLIQYKLNISSNKDNYMKIEIIQNANDDNLTWSINPNNISNNSIIKSNITTNGKTSIILDFSNTTELQEAFISLSRRDNNISHYILKYSTAQYEENFTTYKYNESNIQMSFDRKTNDLNFTIPLIKDSKNKTLSNIKYYLKGFNYTNITTINNINTLFINDDMLREVPLYSKHITPSFLNVTDSFNYTLNLNSTNQTKIYYFTIVGILYDENGNKIDMFGYNVITFKIFSEYTIITLIIFGMVIIILFIIILITLCCVTNKKKVVSVNVDKIENTGEVFPIEKELNESFQENEEGNV